MEISDSAAARLAEGLILRGLRAAARFLIRRADRRRCVPIQDMTKLTDDQRAALVMLAGAGPRGATESTMAMNFTVDLLAGLVRQRARERRARDYASRRQRDDGGQDEDHPAAERSRRCGSINRWHAHLDRATFANGRLIYLKDRQCSVMQISPMEEWHPISSAPFDRDLKLAVIDYDGPHALVFPCRRILCGWISAETKERIDVHPTHWRGWTAS
jgi:hypothetical protein